MSRSMILDPLLEPKNIAIIGASESLNKIGGRPLKFLMKNNYQGDIFLVNPKYPTLHGMRCYETIADIGKPIDLAIIALPAKHVVKTLEVCVQNQVKSAVIFSSGFAEMGFVVYCSFIKG